MKKTLLLLFLAGMYTGFAQTFTVGGISYTVTSATEVAVDANNKTGFTGTTANIPATVTNASVTYNVTSFAIGAFATNTNITSAVIPNSITAIANGAFNGCTNLSNVTIPNGVTEIGNVSFQNTSLTSLTLPSSLTSIGNNTFKDCSELTNLTFPNAVTSIGNSSFNGCTGLTSVSLGNLQSTGISAFQGCTGLTSILIPNSITSLGNNTFSGCTGLTSISVAQENPSNIALGTTVFNGVNTLGCELKVPSAAAKTAYEAADQWSAFSNITVDTTLSISNERNAILFSIHPNPASDILSIRLNRPTTLKSVTIYNALGQTVLQSRETEIGIGSLQSGIYLLSVKTLEGNATKRFVKK
ncbi:MAG: leucine-rich repeat domain-containing protein [Flavobacteriaceae bacterium]